MYITTAQKVYVLASQAYARWDALSPEDQERYRRALVDAGDLSQRAAIALAGRVSSASANGVTKMRRLAEKLSVAPSVELPFADPDPDNEAASPSTRRPARAADELNKSKAS